MSFRKRVVRVCLGRLLHSEQYSLGPWTTHIQGQDHRVNWMECDLTCSRDSLPIDEFGVLQKKDGAHYTQIMSDTKSYDNVCIQLRFDETKIDDISHEQFICTTACYLLDKQNLLLKKAKNDTLL